MKTMQFKFKDMILSSSVGTGKPDRITISNTIHLESKPIPTFFSVGAKIEMNSNDSNNVTKKDFLKISKSKQNKSISSFKTPNRIQYTTKQEKNYYHFIIKNRLLNRLSSI